MTPWRLPPRLSGEQAAAWFRRPRPHNFFGLLAPAVRAAVPRDASSRTPPFVERIWMPAYAVRLHATAGPREHSLWTTVDGWTGQFAILECIDELEQHVLDEDRFPPALDEDEAVQIARQRLLQHVLRARGRIRKPVVDAVEEVRPYFFPVWVLYFRRGRRALDVRTLDAFTGKDGGPKLRVAVLNALVAARRARNAT